MAAATGRYPVGPIVSPRRSPTTSPRLRPLEPYLVTSKVADVMVNCPFDIYLERMAISQGSTASFKDEAPTCRRTIRQDRLPHAGARGQASPGRRRACPTASCQLAWFPALAIDGKANPYHPRSLLAPADGQ